MYKKRLEFLVGVTRKSGGVAGEFDATMARDETTIVAPEKRWIYIISSNNIIISARSILRKECRASRVFSNARLILFPATP